MGRTACKEPQCLYKGDFYLLLPAAIATLYSIYDRATYELEEMEHILIV